MLKILNKTKSLKTLLCCLFIVASLFSVTLAPALTANPPVLKINIFSSQNGKGLEISRQILKKALIDLGHVVYEKELNEKKNKKNPCVDINIFFEIINAEWLPSALANWFIPNPECYVQDLALLDAIDLIVCRTHEVERIFQSLSKKTFFMGFTSLDCGLETSQKDFSLCLHTAGGSPLKGTNAVIKAWSPELLMPHLTIMAHYDISHEPQQNIKWITERMPLDTLRSLRNACGIHLCLSETEGFGHYLMEAMSTGAVVITTDAPPMNEFITDKRCLVPYLGTMPCQLATRYFVDADHLVTTVQNLIGLGHEGLKKIGDNNRVMYLQKTQEFHDNLAILMREEYKKKPKRRKRCLKYWIKKI